MTLVSEHVRLSQQEVKQNLLEILKAFHAFADQNDIRYSLGAGTLLGAVRHRGFIPWDDDIDVYVPRPDYDRIVEAAKGGWHSGSLRFTGFEIDGFPMPFIKMIDSSVRVIDHATKPSIPLHLWIDIFPMDGVPDDEKMARQYLKKTRLFIYLIKAGNYKFFGAGRTRAKRIAKMVVIPFVKMFDLNTWAERKLIDTAQSIRYETAQNVCDVAWNAYGVGEIIPRKKFEKMRLAEFEGCEFFATEGYDEWLRGMYGNYLELPPENKRVSHGVVAERVIARKGQR